jgi:hypothetical protein
MKQVSPRTAFIKGLVGGILCIYSWKQLQFHPILMIIIFYGFLSMLDDYFQGFYYIDNLFLGLIISSSEHAKYIIYKTLGATLSVGIFTPLYTNVEFRVLVVLHIGMLIHPLIWGLYHKRKEDEVRITFSF